MKKDRPDLGFAQELDGFDPASFAPKRGRISEKATPAMATKAAEAAGFISREPRPTATQEGQGAPPPPLRRRRTGRNMQFNIKAKPETIAAFTAVADDQGWGLGETLEKAVELLQKHYNNAN